MLILYIFMESLLWPMMMSDKNMMILAVRPENALPIWRRTISWSLNLEAMDVPVTFLVYVDQSPKKCQDEYQKHEDDVFGKSQRKILAE